MNNAIKIGVTEKAVYTFLEISVYLTGFSKNELLATGMLETYYYTIMKEPDQDTIRAFFNAAQNILNKNADYDGQIMEEIRLNLHPTVKDSLARKIIMLWYTGIWRTASRDLNMKPILVDEMVSAESYIQGLIWSAAETHPAGAKQPGFGSWEYPPL